jgi:flagellar basal body-associated protein FliL
MSTNKNSDIDFSGYFRPKDADKIVDKIETPPDPDKQKKKNLIYITIIVACTLLGTIFWAIYFNQSMPKKAAPGTKEAGPQSNLPAAGPPPQKQP